MTDIRDLITQVRPGEETLLAAVTNLVLSRKQVLNRSTSPVFLDGHDIVKIMEIIRIINNGNPPAEADRYGQQHHTDTIPTVVAAGPDVGDPPRRPLRSRLDGQQSLPEGA